MITSALRHFALTEFQHPELMDNQFAVFLDDVREAYGAPLVITSDARTVAEEQALPGHAEPPESSLHVAIPEREQWARAVDLRWLHDATARYFFDAAVHQVAQLRPVELEFVPFGANVHIHVGLFRDARPSVLIFSPE